MKIYLFIVIIISISSFAITAKVTGRKFLGNDGQKSMLWSDKIKAREISPKECKLLTRKTKIDLLKSRPVDKLTLKILLKYCMTEKRLKLLSFLSSKAKKDLRW